MNKFILVLLSVLLSLTTGWSQGAEEPVKAKPAIVTANRTATAPSVSASSAPAAASNSSADLCNEPCLFAKALTGYIKIDDIKGESRRAGHQDEIETYGLSWTVSQASSSGGSGRVRSRSVIGDIRISKLTDKATPYLIQAQLQNRRLENVTIFQVRQTGSGAATYMKYELRNVLISSYQVQQADSNREYMNLQFENIRISYTTQNPDGSAGDEHEVEFDISAGM